jgi:hypothetical protein
VITPDFTRRGFVKGLSAATLGALAAGYPRQLLGEEPAEKLTPTADTVIVLWMGGGMAATETFDPKRYTPFAKGMNPNTVLSTFPSIPTAVDGIRFSEGLEKLAKVMDRGTLIRSYTAGDLGFILHSRHQFHWHTGYAPPQTVACPHIGAMIARTLSYQSAYSSSISLTVARIDQPSSRQSSRSVRPTKLTSSPPRTR